MTAFLDYLRVRVHDWTESLRDPATGGFRQNDEVGANVMSSTDVAWLRYATNDQDIGGARRDAWVRYLQARQDPRTGMIRHDPGPGGQGHGPGHAFWHTVRALNILGAELPFFPRYLQAVTTPAGLAAWFDATDWESAGATHHETLGLTPLLASLDDPEWAEVFYRKIAEQQSSETGAWPRSRTSISRTFAYTALHLATGRVPAWPKKIVDVMLRLQGPNGFWGETPRFRDMDAAYVLARLPGVIRFREDSARAALEGLASGLGDFYSRSRERLMRDPHWMLAVVHTFGLLQEALPGAFPSRRPFRFDWDRPEMYRCEVIARHAL